MENECECERNVMARTAQIKDKGESSKPIYSHLANDLPELWIACTLATSWLYPGYEVS